MIEIFEPSDTPINFRHSIEAGRNHSTNSFGGHFEIDQKLQKQRLETILTEKIQTLNQHVQFRRDELQLKKQL